MPNALIAEDEPLLARGLRNALALAWPELTVIATVGDGQAAVTQCLLHRPDIVFLDIRMPGLSGIEAAADLADRWDSECAETPFPLVVFVTAYEQYALQAFDAHAVDYLVKPVQSERLNKTVARLRCVLEQRKAPRLARGAASHAKAIDQVVEQLRHLLEAPAALRVSKAGQPQAPWLNVLQASVGNAIHMVPLDTVLLLEAADKYIRVLTADREYLIRTPLRELLPQLDPSQFWQVHRSVVVRVTAIDTVTRDDAGKLWLKLNGRTERLAVSRLYAHRFKPM